MSKSKRNYKKVTTNSLQEIKKNGDKTRILLVPGSAFERLI